MPTFKIFGASKETAEDVQIVVDATDFRDAERKANKMGIYVSKVEPATEPQSTTNVVNTRPNLDPTTPRDTLRKIVHSGCPACGGKDLLKQNVYRLSGPAVVIGYILLIPSFIGIVINAIGLFVVGASMGIMEIVDGEGSACCAGGLLGIGPVVALILCFVGGLLGWILIMKKKVIVCRSCKTIVSTAV
jgi:hypothetical protein